MFVSKTSITDKLTPVILVTVKSRLVHTVRPVVLMEFIRPFEELKFSITAAAAFFFFFGTFLPFNFLIEQALAHGMSFNLSNYLLSILNAAR